MGQSTAPSPFTLRWLRSRLGLPDDPPLTTVLAVHGATIATLLVIRAHWAPHPVPSWAFTLSIVGGLWIFSSLAAWLETEPSGGTRPERPDKRELFSKNVLGHGLCGGIIATLARHDPSWSMALFSIGLGVVMGAMATERIYRQRQSAFAKAHRRSRR